MIAFTLCICAACILCLLITVRMESLCIENNSIYRKFIESTEEAAKEEYGDDWKNHITKKYYNNLINDIRLQSLVRIDMLSYYNDYYNTEITSNYIKVNGEYWYPINAKYLANMFTYILKEMPLRKNRPYIVTQTKHQKMMERINGNDIVNALHEISIVFSKHICIAINHHVDPKQNESITLIKGGRNKYVDMSIYEDSMLYDPLATLIVYICSSDIIKETKDIDFNYSDEHYENLIKLLDSIMSESDWHLWQYGRKEALGSISTYYDRREIKSLYKYICSITNVTEPYTPESKTDM